MLLEDPIEEARRIIRMAGERKITLRLFGGIAFYFRCQSAKNGNLSRNYVDVDFMGHANQAREIKQLFQELGYIPRDRFNAIQGYRRLIFNDVEHQRRVDVFLDVFEMCHKFNFKDRLQTDGETLTMADLLATKLQIVEINEKDLKDILSMFIDHDIGSTDSPELVNGAYLADLCSDDWGIYKTFTMNLERVLRTLDGYELQANEKQVVRLRVEKLKKIIEDLPKSFKWKMRAKVGEKIRWYELPEADQAVIDSRVVSGNSTQEA